MELKLLESSRCFGGEQNVYSHWSRSTACEMRFGAYLPPGTNKSMPVLFWLSGLTCTEQNFITKAHAQRIAAKLGIILINPDTSPRNVNIHKSNMSDALGEGAGFYLDATEKPWDTHYKMYSYITRDLVNVVARNFPVNLERAGIFGHSMGGHGALVIGIRNQDIFKSLSAFSPISSAINSGWGINAFKHYLGDDKKAWQEYDACYLVKEYPWVHGEILIDQGSADPFLKEELKPELFKKACSEAKVTLNFRLQEKYNHNYYFISSFIEDHMHFHAKNLL